MLAKKVLGKKAGQVAGKVVGAVGGVIAGKSGAAKKAAGAAAAAAAGGAVFEAGGRVVRGIGGGDRPRRRRVNVGNVRALRRAMSRVQGFAKLAKATISFTKATKMKGKKKAR
jgi:hypothetical protein